MKAIVTGLVVMIFCLNCGKEVVEPEWPRYKFGGTVQDSITRNPVDNCIVTISSASGAPAYGLMSGTDTTDSSGTFLIDSVLPGDYKITAVREDYLTFAGRVIIEDRDQLDYRISLLRISDAPHIVVSVDSFNTL